MLLLQAEQQHRRDQLLKRARLRNSEGSLSDLEPGSLQAVPPATHSPSSEVLGGAIDQAGIQGQLVAVAERGAHKAQTALP